MPRGDSSRSSAAAARASAGGGSAGASNVFAPAFDKPGIDCAGGEIRVRDYTGQEIQICRDPEHGGVGQCAGQPRTGGSAVLAATQ